MLTSHELIGFMSPALAEQIIAFAFESDKALYRATLAAVAEAKKVRPVFLERQPRTQRHATMLSVLTRPNMELIAGNLIRQWLLKKETKLVCQFLDALAIQHKEGVIDDFPASVEDEKLKAAIDGLLANFPRETVAVYLIAFNDMNEANWPNLKSQLETDSRLQLGQH